MTPFNFITCVQGKLSDHGIDGVGQGKERPGLPQVYGIIKGIIHGRALRCAYCAHQRAICSGWEGFVPGGREQRGSGSGPGGLGVGWGPDPRSCPRPAGLLLPSSEPQILHQKKDRGSYGLYESK